MTARFDGLDRRTFLKLAGTSMLAATGCGLGSGGDAASLVLEPHFGGTKIVDSLPPLFGNRRELAFPPLERSFVKALDGNDLCLHHTSGGNRGPVIIAPGTAMTGLSFCIDTVPLNLVEYLVAEGFDVWLFDWRTSPLLAAHRRPYTMSDVAQYDWPAAIAEVQRRTGKKRVSVLAHCLSSPCFLLSAVRGYVSRDDIGGFVASAVGVDLVMTDVGMFKLDTRVDKLLPPENMIHQRPEDVTDEPSDVAISMLAQIVPKSYSCDNPACYRHSATFGDLVLHERLNEPTHAIMGDLVPRVLTAFLQDVGRQARNETVLTKQDEQHLDRLAFPIQLISGSENRMFVPESTKRSFERLSSANGSNGYTRTVYEGFGHLDCYIGKGADELVWPKLLPILS